MVCFSLNHKYIHSVIGPLDSFPILYTSGLYGGHDHPKTEFFYISKHFSVKCNPKI